MNNLSTSCGLSTPSAFITTKKSRIKQHNSTVYLQNGNEFEIELFNPKQKKVLAKIKINGIQVSTSGIVVRPGERVFLERFLDSNSKFKFETYEVSGTNKQVQEAIKNNGNIEIEFYDEYEPWFCGNPTITIAPPSNPWWLNPTTITCDSASTGGYGQGLIPSNYYNNTFTLGNNDTSTLNIGSSSLQNSVNTCFFSNTSSGISGSLKESKVETGRIEKGNISNQSFVNDYSNYNSYYSSKVEWHILPLSTKPVETGDIKQYCSNCGFRIRKSSDNFCSKCGTKL